MARKPYLVKYYIFMHTNAHTNFSGWGDRYTDFLCKKHNVYCYYKQTSRLKLTDIKINTYSYHENVGSSSTDSIYGTLHSFVSKQNLVSTPP